MHKRDQGHMDQNRLYMYKGALQKSSRSWQKSPTKENHSTALQNSHTKEPSKRAYKEALQNRYKKALQKSPAKESYKRAIQKSYTKSRTKESYKRMLQKSPTKNRLFCVVWTLVCTLHTRLHTAHCTRTTPCRPVNTK